MDDRIVGDPDMPPRAIGAPMRKINSAPVIVEDQIVVDIDFFEQSPVLDRHDEARTATVADDIGEDFDVFKFTEPGVKIDALASDAIDKIVVDLAAFARLLDVDAFLVVAKDVVVGDLEIDGTANAQRFVRRLATPRYACRSELPSGRLSDRVAQNADVPGAFIVVICIPHGNARRKRTFCRLVDQIDIAAVPDRETSIVRVDES